jgi:hypothetical protein
VTINPWLALLGGLALFAAVFVALILFSRRQAKSS